MKLSDFELSAYDFIAIMLPGSLSLAEIGVTTKGFFPFWEWASNLSISGGIFAALFAFGGGQLVSQAAYELSILIFRGRGIRGGRDRYWMKNAEAICSKLISSYDIDIQPTNDQDTCDRAFNHCQTIIGASFEKRKVFSLVSALSLSLWFLSITAIIPTARVSYLHRHEWHQPMVSFVALTTLFGFTAFLSWRRTELYSTLADVTVFHIFEATKFATPIGDKSSHSPANYSDSSEYITTSNSSARSS
jgi:hypothetical protein